MPEYRAPVEDTLFILNDVLTIGQYDNLANFSEAGPELIAQIVQEAAKLCETQLFPLNQIGDRQGCTRHDDGRVTTPEGFKEAYAQYTESGWMGLDANPDYGGQGLPHIIAAAISEFMSSSNMAFAMYPGLTKGAVAALNLHATDALKSTYLPRMIEGKWTGTMNLTEPHCGTDLGLLRTKAVPNDDGSYAISGTKIFISAGEHDLSENIVHLVLARIEGAPVGVKGISLFVVPKFFPDEAGEAGAANAVSCGSIEEKMGIHGNATCVMNFDGATGWLVGEANAGLKAMFTMMNEARLGVGIQGLAQSEVAYQNAVTYAKDRRQGRAPSGPVEPDKEADPIIAHPDVRRTLLNIRAFNEAGRAFMLWTALQVDLGQNSPDAETRKNAGMLLSLVTPVVKGVLTDQGFANAVQAQQIYGGHGYIQEWGMEQFVRDSRISMIYEGTNGVQALDLVGRKLGQNGGAGLLLFFKLIDECLAEIKGDEMLAAHAKALSRGRADLEKATGWLMNNAMAKPDNGAAGAYDYMHLFGLVALAWMWARIGQAAQRKLASGDGDKDFLTAKLSVGRYFAERIVPETGAHLRRIESGADTLMALPPDMF